jgi:mannose-6-phosphate isomerase
MGLFINKSSLLYGFRPYSQITDFLKDLPEFSSLIESKARSAFTKSPAPDTFKSIVSSLLQLPKTTVRPVVGSFFNKLKDYRSLLGENVVDVITRIHQHFPEDIGHFFPLLLNTIVGEPGRALYIPTGVLHSYISGDLYEAMALSDNVVRAAMTPKHIDVPTLLARLPVSPTNPHWVNPTLIQPNVQKYVPPSSEFLLYRIVLKAGQEVRLPSFPRDAVVSVLQGSVQLNGNEQKAGTVLLYGLGSGLVGRATTDCVVVCCSYD